MAVELGRRLLAEVQEVGLDEVSRGHGHMMIPHNSWTICRMQRLKKAAKRQHCILLIFLSLSVISRLVVEYEP